MFWFRQLIGCYQSLKIVIIKKIKQETHTNYKWLGLAVESTDTKKLLFKEYIEKDNKHFKLVENLDL